MHVFANILGQSVQNEQSCLRRVQNDQLNLAGHPLQITLIYKMEILSLFT